MNIAYDLFLLMFNLSQIRDRNRIITIFVEGMNEVFKPAYLNFSADGVSDDIFQLEIRTKNSLFGFIRVEKTGSLSGEDFMLLRNSVQMLAVILENKKFQSKIQNEKKSLEQLADDRLLELNQLVIDLQAEIERRTESEEFLKTIITKSPLPIAVTEKNHKIELFNDKFTELYGYTLNDVDTVEDWWQTAYPDAVYREKVQEGWYGSLESAQKNNIDFKPQSWKIVIKDGSTRICDFYSVMLGTKNLIVVQDITEREQTKTKLLSLLDEKDFLMKEINHRVKNNLNMISSLISLKSAETAHDLTDIKSQIDAIRIVHEKLTQTEQIKTIAAKDYLENLLTTIFSNFTAYEVSIKVSAGKISLPSVAAVPFGLIVNEMATNAIKYGFKPEKKEWFSVNISKLPESELFKLVVSNSGTPIPGHINLDNPQTLGLRLISALVKQLNGTIDLQRTPFPVFTIHFPIPEST